VPQQEVGYRHTPVCLRGSSCNRCMACNKCTLMSDIANFSATQSILSHSLIMSRVAHMLTCIESQLGPNLKYCHTSDCWCASLPVPTATTLTPCHGVPALLLPQDCYEIPLQVTVPGQPLPLPVKLRLQATTSDLVLGPKTLDFGRVPLTEAAGVYITITNPSALPQGFSFGSKLPLGLELSPNSGGWHWPARNLCCL
jgi:hypothetical protein